MNEQLLDEARKLIVGFFVNRRKELGLTQQDVADKAGLSLRTVKGFELMQFWPGLKQYISLCHALDLEVSVKKSKL
jgi:transcriptional regulator with XRE-family HTH domain